MKSKISKIIVSVIFVLLILLMLQNNVKARVDGYFTKADIKWNHTKDNGEDNEDDDEADTDDSDGGWITVNGYGNFYCRNHGYNLTGKLVREPIDNPAKLSLDWMKNTKFNDQIKGFKRTKEELIKENNRVLKLTFGPKESVSDTLEASFYAFADEYCKNPSKYVQSSLWYFLNKHPEYLPKGETSKAGEETTLCEAAEYYVDEWIPNNKADLKTSDKDAKVRISGKYYIAGPFTVKYNEKEYTVEDNKIIFSELIGHTIKDQNNKYITSAQITNSDGTMIFKGIPNGIPFYIKFPYSDTITELKIEDGVKYIDTVEAFKEDVKTETYEAKYSWSDSSQSRDIYETKHGSHNENCPSDCSSNHSYRVFVRTEKKGSTTGTLKYTKITTPYQNMRRFEGKVNYKTDSIKLSVPIIPPETPPPSKPRNEMDLAGYVWEDMPEGKDQTVNGLKDGNDKSLEGIEVRLYDVTTGKLAKVYKSTNPVLTDANGHYEFIGLDPTHKYYVKFTYDGILYTNTYGAGIPEYNTPAWNASSKGSELVSGRNALNEKFKTISSYPASYKVPKQIFDGNYLTNGYNKIFTITDIQNGTGLVGEYKNKITSQLNSYLSSNKRLEDGEQNYFNNVYWPIIRSSSNQTEAKQVLQYIWDCRIDAIAGNESERDGTTKQPKVGLKLYPVYDKFALTDKNGNRLTATDSTTTYNGYRMIYNGQLHINLGLIKRPTTDLELTEDLYRAVVSINGQDETYNFGTFDKKGLKINASDAQIKQSVATADYNYADYVRGSITDSSGLPGEGEAAYPENYAPIEMYITYRINVKNNSSMPTSVNEIVSYIDTNYYSYSNTYQTTSGKKLTGITGTYLYPSKGENGAVTERTEKALADYSKNNFGLKVNEHSKYGTGSETGGNLGIGKELFISFDNDIILENNQMIAVYITYRLGENSTSHSKFNCTYNNPNRPNDGNHAYTILQDSLAKGDESKRITVYTRAEINAYSTFFRKGADPETTQGKYSYPYTSAVNSGQLYRAAGVFDAVSMPGNLDEEQLKVFNEQNNKKTEDDWDRSSAFVIVDPNATRTMKGNVWETVNQPANYWLENKNLYPKYEGSNGAGDITAELIEIKDGIEYVRAKTKTNSDGSYSFTEYIPGQYVVRFIYGDTANYETKEQYSPYTTFELNDYQYPCAYNGEFYQSGKANPDTNINDDNHRNNNQYWYANDTDVRYSDAYDEANRRMEVNNLLNTYKYSDVLSLQKHPTDYMVYAYTSLLDVEIEYAKEETTSSNNRPAYTIENIDFALTPRTESKLEINKEVTRLKLILQNGTVQFDASTEDIREQKVPAVVQAAQGHDINISMSSELVNGATLEITYKITITNVGPKDTITYYKDSSGKVIALGFYEEDPTKIVYYENDIRTYNNTYKDNNGTHLAFIIGKDNNGVENKWTSYITSGLTEMAKLDTTRTTEEVTTTRAVTVADYVSNNLNFTKQSYTGAVINEAWDLITDSKEDFDKTYYRQKQNDTVEENLPPRIGASSQNKEQREQNPLEMDASEVYDSNIIVISNAKNKLVNADLKPGEDVSEEIVLSKVISVNDNSTDKKSYNNNVRILEINNKVSRVQNMNGTNLKYTSARVIVSDPTGIGNAYLGIILALAVAVIIGSGIILIKKFVIKK